jgi:hypothetical protein
MKLVRGNSRNKPVLEHRLHARRLTDRNQFCVNACASGFERLLIYPSVTQGQEDRQNLRSVAFNPAILTKILTVDKSRVQPSQSRATF